MKILLAAINSKYIHSNLAVFSLRRFAQQQLAAEEIDAPEIEIAEYTINQPQQKLLMDIYKKQPDVIFFSCYIWNREEMSELVGDLGKILPDTDIWLGGPEVSYDAAKTLDILKNAKGVLCGEGEETFCELVKAYAKGSLADLEGSIAGTVIRKLNGEICAAEPRKPMELDDVRFAYEGLEEFENRIVYYESSRGCPFRCSYCLSSIDKTLRTRSLEKVKAELKFFMDHNVPQVKFIDRTFNCDHGHAVGIWKFLKENDNGVTNFHFEISADLLTDEELELLAELRPGQVQFEIGVQSTNPETLKEIRRPMDFDKVKQTVKRLKAADNIHLHLDLIAGLPFENMASFRSSFNDVFEMRPEQLQLGFLKVLKGTYMESQRDVYGLKYMAKPPYEVLGTRWISYGELVKLKMIEEMVEVYYNSGQFVKTLELLLPYFESPFDMFEALAGWYEERGIEMLNLSRNSRYEELLEFGRRCIGEDKICEKSVAEEQLLEAISYDYYARENVKSRPAFLGEDKVEKAFAKEFYSMQSREHSILHGGQLDTEDPRLLRRLTHIEKLGGKYYLFDYTRRNPMTGNAAVQVISEK